MTTQMEFTPNFTTESSIKFELPWARFPFSFFFFCERVRRGWGGVGALKFAPNCGGCCKFKTNFLIKLLCPRVNSNYTGPHRHLASLSICQRYFIFCYFFFLFYLLVSFPCPFFLRPSSSHPSAHHQTPQRTVSFFRCFTIAVRFLLAAAPPFF